MCFFFLETKIRKFSLVLAKPEATGRQRLPVEVVASKLGCWRRKLVSIRIGICSMVYFQIWFIGDGPQSWCVTLSRHRPDVMIWRSSRHECCEMKRAVGGNEVEEG